jgi:2-oxoglutarate ferredoxin oxidoreductase subunit alpha
MAEKVLMKGNEAICEAAITAGCRHFFGYPITPQNEIPAYMSKRMPAVDGVYLQAESETAAINMVYGAAGCGVRAMTSSSSPGISLKQEGISYIAACDLPCLIVNIVRAGPGLGGILSAQCDYYQMVKGGGHGDYKLFVLAPNSVQEMFDLTIEAFDIADLYRIPVVLLGDGTLGQMMEPVEIKEYKKKDLPKKDWATTGTMGKRERNIINSLHIEPDVLEGLNIQRFKKYKEIEKKEARYEDYNCDNADIIMVAYGTTSRIVKSVVPMAKKKGIKVGVIRPITLWPFPVEVFKKYAPMTNAFLTVEMSMGQMVDDVKIAVNGKKPIYFYGRTGGIIPTPDEIFLEVEKILGGETK